MKYYVYTVEGSTFFPLDMLRRDCSYPHDDNSTIELSLALKYEDRRIFRITLRSLKHPTTGRWDSFGWPVKEIRHDHTDRGAAESIGAERKIRHGKYWRSEPPMNCDICKGKINGDFIDGKTIDGPWAILCPTCHTIHGIGFGTGRGQQYTRIEGNLFQKTNG